MGLAVLVIGGLCAGGAALVSRRLPAGQRPDDHPFPEGVGPERILRQTIETTSGRCYRVTSYAGPESLYFVAERKGSVDWLGYLQTPGSAERWLWSASAPTDEALEAMRRDLGVLQLPQPEGGLEQ